MIMLRIALVIGDKLLLQCGLPVFDIREVVQETDTPWEKATLFAHRLDVGAALQLNIENGIGRVSSTIQDVGLPILEPYYGHFFQMAVANASGYTFPATRQHILAAARDIAGGDTTINDWEIIL